MSVRNITKDDTDYTPLNCKCGTASTCTCLDIREDNDRQSPTDYIDHNNYPKSPWYIDLVKNFISFSSAIIPDFVKTNAASSLSQVYSNDVLFKVASGKIDKNKKFIYLVHGRKGHPSDLHYISTFLTETTDYNIIPTYIPNSKNCSILTGANVLKAIINDTHGEIKEECKDIYIIAHSKGGVVSMYFNEILALNKIPHILTIATPINGTSIASYAMDYYTRLELSHNSECLALINKLAQTNKVTSYYHVAVEKDHVIIPSITSAIPNKHPLKKCSIIKNVCHMSVLCSNALMEILDKWLTK